MEISSINGKPKTKESFSFDVRDNDFDDCTIKDSEEVSVNHNPSFVGPSIKKINCS
jgi:hypothetical protein